jgi:hypothetical protein
MKTTNGYDFRLSSKRCLTCEDLPGLDRHSGNGGSKVATERRPAIAGLAGSTRKFLAVVRRVL